MRVWRVNFYLGDVLIHYVDVQAQRADAAVKKAAPDMPKLADGIKAVKG